jgi:alkanesulfonate monooxygenase SsuD/methylene tetrahydromethanopterin reductase-like flavin-dependent oxidoreductase (luciferase family)
MALAAEEAGFESVWVPEHLIMPVTMTGAPNTPHAGRAPDLGVHPGATRLLVSPSTNPREAAEGFRRFGDEIIAKL